MRVRESKFELLRIICMLFVITEHFVPYICDMQNFNGGGYYVGNVIRSFCIVAVNCFVLLSGYFGIKIKMKRIFQLDAVVWFWGLTGLVLSVATGMHLFQAKTDILFLFPIITKRNWFVTTYIVLYLISPFLNFMIQRLNKKQFQCLIFLMVILFYMVPTVQYTLNAPTVTLDNGYGIVNFVCLYFMGGYIRLYVGSIKKAYVGAGYLMSCLILFAANHVMSVLMGFYFNTYISYDTIFCLMGAVCLFLWFREVDIQSKLINRIAEYSFAAFIIHTSPFYGEIIYKTAAQVSERSVIFYILTLIVTPFMIYGLSMCLESMRLRIFGKIENAVIDKIVQNRYILLKNKCRK